MHLPSPSFVLHLLGAFSIGQCAEDFSFACHTSSTSCCVFDSHLPSLYLACAEDSCSCWCCLSHCLQKDAPAFLVTPASSATGPACSPTCIEKRYQYHTNTNTTNTFPIAIAAPIGIAIGPTNMCTKCRLLSHIPELQPRVHGQFGCKKKLQPFSSASGVVAAFRALPRREQFEAMDQLEAIRVRMCMGMVIDAVFCSFPPPVFFVHIRCTCSHAHSFGQKTIARPHPSLCKPKGLKHFMMLHTHA